MVRTCDAVRLVNYTSETPSQCVLCTYPLRGRINLKQPTLIRRAPSYIWYHFATLRNFAA